MAAPSEAAIIGSTTSVLASIQVNSNSARANVQNSVSPPLPSVIQNILNATAGGTELDLDAGIEAAISRAGDLSGLPEDEAELLEGTLNTIRDIQKECIPCNLRVALRASLPELFNESLLSTLENLIESYLRALNFIVNLLSGASVYQDICLVLRGINTICIPDLQRIVSLLNAMLYRLTSAELGDADMMKLVVLPIFQPIFMGIALLFQQFRLLVTDPLNCVVNQLDFTIQRLKVGSLATQGPGATATEQLIKYAIADTEEENQQITDAFSALASGGATLDQGLTAIQNSLGGTLTLLRNTVSKGIRETEELANSLIEEVQSFVGISEEQTNTYLTMQFQKLLYFRLIGLISALIEAKASNFECALGEPNQAKETLEQFIGNFLDLDANVSIDVDDAGDLQLVFDATIGNASDGVSGVAITTTGDEEIDNAVNAILTQATTPKVVKPPCLFSTTDESDNKLAEYIAMLDSTEV